MSEEQLLNVLKNRDMTVKELSNATKMQKTLIYQFMKKMENEGVVGYTKEKVHSSKQTVKVYSISP